jgi:hypothetical protein
MRVFVPPHWSRAIARVAAALRAYAPASVTLVDTPSDADLIVLHVVGRRDQVKTEVDWALKSGQRYAMIQYVLRSTQKSHCVYWIDLWQRAQVVWSYYDLPTLAAEDGVRVAFPFYRAPLGAYSSVFFDRQRPRKFVALTHGTSWLCEGVREVVLAARAHGRTVFHLGPHVRGAADMVSERDITDDRLADRYSACDYVAALRRIEGFELPAAEGLLCGARPILYDQPHYRHWFGDWAEYVLEGKRRDVECALVDLFARPVRTVTTEERAAAAEWFSWPRIAKGFWAQCLNS